MRRVLPILFAALPLLLAGCGSPATDVADADGHYVNYRWSVSQKSCSNNSCVYGSNHETFSTKLDCSKPPTLSWDANSWVHGSVVARVHDQREAVVGSHTVSSNGFGSQLMEGQGPTWTLEGSTSDANGNVEIRLACF